MAEDDLVSQRLLRTVLTKWDYTPVVVNNGAEAWEILQRDDTPHLAILDWMMPVMDGVDVCRAVRALERDCPTYLILLTAKGRKEDIVAGLRAGADDFLVKPFDREELHARLHVGVRVVKLQAELSARVRELEEAISKIKTLQGLLPICCYCKKIRDDHNYWQQVEEYVALHSEAQFSHGVCPDCYEKVLKPQLDGLKRSPPPTPVA
jgi:CheY-like chemotaxis protein